MTDRELLEALYADMQDMKADMKNMKADMQNMKADIQDMKADIQALKSELEIVKQKVSRLELSLENETNHNIQLLAENHMSLVDKLNEAIRVQDKSILLVG